MLTSNMKYFAIFLAILLHNTSFLDAISISIVCNVGPSVSQGTIFEIYETNGGLWVILIAPIGHFGLVLI